MAAIKTLSCDLETYSSVDITKCGCYKYAESPDFEILLFAYSCDYGPVTLIDLAQGEVIPDEVVEWIYDPEVEKTAFNANFERTCLARHFDRYCEPEQWSCTMILAAQCGLPMSLAGVGAALELPEDKAKMKEGKELIRYFCQPCKPTKSNGQRTRNLPEHAPDKWKVFCDYNIRDVETENTIRKMLLKWRPDFTEQKLWCIDQRMNDQGVRIEPKLAECAIQIGNKYRDELIARCKQLTGLDNPNSTAQIKSWLEEQEGVEVLSLNKKAIADVYASLNADETKEVLKLREEFSKSSNKKYEAFLRSCCADNHVRGTFQFYGASTGRWCLTGDHEVLTPEGWVRLDEWSGGKIACWNIQQESLSFQKSAALEFDYEGEMFLIDSQRCAQISTPDHKMAYMKRGLSPWKTATMSELFGKRFDIPFNGRRLVNYATDPNILRVLIMVQADGHYTDDGILRLRFAKQRKVERCKTLLRRTDIPYTISTYSDGNTVFSIPLRNQPVWLRSFRDKEFGWWMLDEDPRVIVEELEYWDGYRCGPNSIQYVTCNKHNAEVIQAVCSLGGYSATLLCKGKEYRKYNWSDAYYINIWLTPGRYTEIRSEHQTKIDHYGKVYCASTPTGFFMVRRNGKVWITGNSGRNVQLQNLPHDTLPDLDDARMLALTGDEEDFECMYPKVQSALSALIRTMIIPEEGQRLIVADYSAIEARVIAWIAKEQWRIDAFANGEDIYCASASKAFRVPVVKHGINGELRAKGKIIELACIAEDQLVLTDRGLIPIQDVTPEMKVWDGEEWVEHEGVIYKGVKDVYEYDGLTATADHLVFIEGQPWPIYFGIAAACGSYLLQTGDGRNAIRMGEDNKFREEMEREVESLLRTHGMYGVWVCRLDEFDESTQRQIQRMSELLRRTKEDSAVVGSETYSSEAKMRESQRRWVQKLWGAWNQVRLPECDFSRSLDDRIVRSSRQKHGDRSDRYEWGLCPRESQMGDTQDELFESEEMCVIKMGSAVLAIFSCGRDSETFRRLYEGADYRASERRCVRQEKELARYKGKARVYDIRNAGRNHRYTVSGKLVHNCGYGGSIGAMRNFGADRMGMTEEEMADLVAKWREASPRIVALWKALEDAATRCIKKGRPTISKLGGIKFAMEDGVMWMTLPSGRRIAYWGAEIAQDKWGRSSLSYMTMNQVTKKWERTFTHGGKLAENLTQATARDVLKEALFNLNSHHYSVRATVHDEVIITATPDQTLEEVIQLMCQGAEWTEGLPLNADGYYCSSYRKD